ncbi:MAG: hypothetical protein C4345_00640, partial [Chloroflexota bacterium]
MAIHDVFTPDEWTLLAELPVRVIAAAVAAEPAGEFGTIKELVAGLTSLSSGAMISRENALIQTVFEIYKHKGQGEHRALELSDQATDQIIPDTLERCRQASEILARAADPEDAEDFKRWLYRIAEEVVAASRSGGFLGLGGQR